MNNLIIVELEKLLLRIKKSPSASQSGLIREFLRHLCVYIGASSVRSPQKILFDQKNSGQQRKFIAVSFLRLLCTDGDAIWGLMDLRNHVFELFDEEISESYDNLGIKIEDDNHQKFIRLKDAENTLLQAFESITKSIVSLQTATDIRNRFMHNLKIPLNKLFLDQYVEPSVISEERIREIFSVLDQYVKSSTIERLDHYRNLRSIFDTYLDDAENSKSNIASQCVIGPLKKMKDIVDQDFSNNDAIKPTSITLRDLNRKYPFHIRERKILIKFLLQVHGPGHAFDTNIEISESDDSLEILNPFIYFGPLGPSKTEIAFEAVVKMAIDYKPILMGVFSWSNYDGTTNAEDFIFELIPQKSDIDWEVLRISKPYSLEPVETEKELVGRNELLKTLFAKFISLPLESAIVYGQKRVGKTSIAKTLQNKLSKF